MQWCRFLSNELTHNGDRHAGRKRPHTMDAAKLEDTSTRKKLGTNKWPELVREKKCSGTNRWRNRKVSSNEKRETKSFHRSMHIGTRTTHAAWEEQRSREWQGHLARELRSCARVFFLSSFWSMLIVPHCKWNVQLNQIDSVMSAN